MLTELAAATALVLLTVLIHGSGLLALTRMLRLEESEERLRHLSPTSAKGILFSLILVSSLFALHGVEIWLYALFYVSAGAMANLHDAVFFSTITYSTIGYDDHGLVAWRLVAAIEGINGILLMGWTTAFFVTMMGRLWKR